MNIHKLTTEKWQSVTIISVMETQTQICPFRGSVLYITCIIIVNIIIQKSYTNLTCISYPQLTEDSAYVNGESIVQYTCSFIVF